MLKLRDEDEPKVHEPISWEADADRSLARWLRWVGAVLLAVPLAGFSVVTDRLREDLARAPDDESRSSILLGVAYGKIQDPAVEPEAFISSLDTVAGAFDEVEFEAIKELLRGAAAIRRNDLESALVPVQRLEMLEPSRLTATAAGLARVIHGNVHLLQSDWSEARERYESARGLLEARPIQDWALANLYQNLSHVEMISGRPEVARRWLDRSIAIAEEQELEELLVDALLLGSRMDLGDGRLNRAENQARRAVAALDPARSQLEYLMASRYLAEALAGQQRGDEAAVVLATALSAAAQGGLHGERAELETVLARVEEARGNSSRALRSMERALEAQRQHFDLERARRLSTLEAGHQLALREIEQQYLKTELRQRNRLTVVLVVGTLLLTIVTILLLHSLRAQHRANSRLSALSMSDALTGISNRRGFEHDAAIAMKHARRSGGAISVLMLDLDHFKRINDELGHETGDRVLREVATAIAGALREQDEVARWGGEEFSVLLPDTNIEGARFIAERLRREIAALSGAATDLTATIGVAAILPDEALESALARADALLYEGKRAGRDRIICSG